MAVTDEQLYEFVTSSLDDFGEKANWCVCVRACMRVRACVRACAYLRELRCVHVRIRVCAHAPA
jgi:hypothetical protein